MNSPTSAKIWPSLLFATVFVPVFSTSAFCRSPFARSARGRAAALSWLVALVLLFQFLVAGSHQHELDEPMQDCAICHVAGQALDLPPGTPPVIAAMLVLVACILAQRATPLPRTSPHYIFPPGRAPPFAS